MKLPGSFPTRAPSPSLLGMSYQVISPPHLMTYSTWCECAQKSHLLDGCGYHVRVCSAGVRKIRGWVEGRGG